jgi:hypothetical protein
VRKLQTSSLGCAHLRAASSTLLEKISRSIACSGRA